MEVTEVRVVTELTVVNVEAVTEVMTQVELTNLTVAGVEVETASTQADRRR